MPKKMYTAQTLTVYKFNLSTQYTLVAVAIEIHSISDYSLLTICSVFSPEVVVT